MDDSSSSYNESQQNNNNLDRLLQANCWYQFFYYPRECDGPNSPRDSQLHIRKRIKVDQETKSTYVKESELIDSDYIINTNDKYLIPKPYKEYVPVAKSTHQGGQCAKVTYPIFVRSKRASYSSEGDITEIYTSSDPPNTHYTYSKIDANNLAIALERSLEDDARIESSLPPVSEMFSKKYQKKTSKFDSEQPYSSFDICPTKHELFRQFIGGSSPIFKHDKLHDREKINMFVKKHLKLLLFSEAQDETIKNIILAAQELHVECTQFDKVNEIEHTHQPADVIIVDVRTMGAIPYTVQVLCGSCRKCFQEVMILALVKRDDFEKNNLKILHLLDIGFNRCVIENPSYTACYNELIMILNSDMRISWKAFTFNSLFFAASLNSSDLIIVLDNEYYIRHCSTSIQEHLQYEIEDVLGKSIREKLIPISSIFFSFERAISKSSTWQGTLQIENKNHETVAAQCNACKLDGERTFAHIVMSLYVYGPLREKKVSVGTGHSEFMLTNIVNAIILIEEARDKFDKQNETYILLSKVIGLLDSVNVVKTVKMIEQISDPIASDLITALLDTKQSTSRMGVEKKDSRKLTSKIFTEENQNYLSWQYDILLKEKTNTDILVTLGMELFQQFNILQVLNCSESVLKNWLVVIANHYHKDVPYHNATHAADVMQACAVFLTSKKLRLFLDSSVDAACLISAVAHDLDHHGKSNAFLCNSNHIWALLYNDLTVLENHHVSLMFQLTLSDDRVNIFKHTDSEQYKEIRYNIIDLVLSTDMTKHFDILTKFVNEFSAIPYQTEDVVNALNSPEKLILMYRMIIKCADVSNPTRNFKQSVEWCRRITEEYCKQTDEEKSMGLPVVMPMFDRETCSMPKAQIGFIEYIINDLFEAWNAFIDMPELLRNMRKNYKLWKKLDEMGYNTLATFSPDNPLINDDLLSFKNN